MTTPDQKPTAEDILASMRKIVTDDHTDAPQTSSSQKPLRAGELSLAERMIQIWGALFIIAGVCCFFDVGRIASNIFASESNPEMLAQFVGGTIILIGVVDIFVIPRFLASARARKIQTK